jgi:Spy/CpxP family protein refolding chaperone
MTDDFFDQPGFWDSPDQLRAAAARLRTKTYDHRVEMMRPMQSKPEPSFKQQLAGQPYDDSAARTARAHMEILRALETEKQQTAQQQQRARNEAQAAFGATAIGQLLRRRT